MTICGIISEYNPFHHGHRYHIEKTKELTQCDLLINVMSGNFVQRGEPAIIDKWERAKTAIREGCDIVIELPYAYALQGADGFAFGAIRSLQLAGVQSLVFGSESNDINALKKLSKASITTKKDTSLASAHQVKSNDILGIAYLKALTGTGITPYTIQRTNEYHDTTLSSTIVSATAIRKAVLQGKAIDTYTSMADQLNASHAFAKYYPYLQYLLLTLSPTYLSSLFLMDEGIEHLLISQAKIQQDLESFLNACVSKRYTRAKIQRTLIHLLTQTTKKEINFLPPLDHLRILAFNEKGRAHLKTLKQKEICIASKFSQIPKCYREMDLRAASAYALPLSNEQRIAFYQGEVRSPLQVNL